MDLHHDAPGDQVEAPGGISRPPGWTRPSLRYRRYLAPGVVTVDPDV